MRRVTPDWHQDFFFHSSSSTLLCSWKPGFIDYLFLAFCFSTALSPADSFPLTHRTKLLVMVQATHLAGHHRNHHRSRDQYPVMGITLRSHALCR